ncbi:restriction endonuclease subunit S [Olleya sp. AS48]|uniref:restriction endonuclease subunit S n=1 Tax=Olleya sp. AS48 TaxID=3135774 RepID=UPI00317F4A1D
MEYELGDIIHGTIDYRGKTPKRFDSGIPVLSAANVKKGKIKIDDKFISKEYYDKWTTRGFIKPGDILITTEAPVGEIAKVPGDQVYMISRRVFALQVNEDLADETYIYYLLLTEGVLKYFESISHGATAPRIYKDEVLKLKIDLPELPTQKKTASILSAYDDLIENNNQRIKLLEEMAEEIYKEWFVRFRFPGYKEATFLDKEGNKVAHGSKGAIPEGWEKRPTKDIVDIISGYAFKTESFEEDGDYGLVTIKNVQNGFFVTKTTDYIKELPKNIKDDIFLKDKDILLSLTGNIGRICLVYGDNYLLNQRVAKLKPKTKDLFEYVYLFFRSDFLRMTLENYSNGAAQQNLSPVDTSELKFITPPDDLLEKFSDITKSFFDEIIILLKKNKILQDTRDLLLPRLISGKLSVEDLEVGESLNRAAEPQEKYSK